MTKSLIFFVVVCRVISVQICFRSFVKRFTQNTSKNRNEKRPNLFTTYFCSTGSEDDFTPWHQTWNQLKRNQQSAATSGKKFHSVSESVMFERIYEKLSLVHTQKKMLHDTVVYLFYPQSFSSSSIMQGWVSILAWRICWSDLSRGPSLLLSIRCLSTSRRDSCFVIIQSSSIIHGYSI